ncbi:MAG: polymer-forming cytoskeletal protein [Proteobacteria bacterium]|nr:polymer-forming cytoskeletal protein [Pseudomonadota bacterium]
MTNTTSNVSEVVEKDVTTILADDLEIKGTIKFKSSLMIKGVLEGEIISEGLLIIGSTAKVTATITTKNLISYGEIQGDVTASEQVILKSTAVHNGNVTTRNIVIENGSVFNGSCMMKARDINPV